MTPTEPQRPELKKETLDTFPADFVVSLHV